MKAHQLSACGLLALVSLSFFALGIRETSAAPFVKSRASSSVPAAPQATITVTNTNDSGVGSLRNAINTASNGDTINFAVTGTITLTSGELYIAKTLNISGPGANSLTVSGDHASRVFEINIGNAVTISHLTISKGYTNTTGGGGIYNSGRLVLSNVTLTNNIITGTQNGGGAIFNSTAATLVVTNSMIVSNTSQNFYAGGIYNYHAVLTMTNSFVMSNTGTSGAGLATQGSNSTIVSSTISHNVLNSAGSNGGGGIYSDGASVTTLINSRVMSNTTSAAGGGIANESTNSILILMNSSVISNVVSGGYYGGGIHNGGIITANASSVLSNTAFDGGGIYNDGGEILFSTGKINGNQAADTGGGIFNNEGKMKIDQSTLFSNTTHFGGGGIYNRYDMTVTNSTVTSNTANFGGGIYTSFFDPLHPTVLISNTSILSNTALNSVGGGIGNFQGHLILINSAVLSNTAPNYGGGIDSEGISGTLQLTNVLVAQNSVGSNNGGGIYTSHPTTITNSTISSNQAGYGGGIYPFVSSAVLINATVTNNSASSQGGGIYQSGSYSVSLKNTIVAGNPSPSASPDCSGTLVSLGYNLLGDNTGCLGLTNGVNGDKVGTGASPLNPLLGPLQNNGGPTWTHVLLLSSPAINAGNPLGCTNALGILLQTDQRGMPRPYGGPCDIGAFEYFAPYFLPVILHP